LGPKTVSAVVHQPFGQGLGAMRKRRTNNRVARLMPLYLKART
jgi:hypothetical protein